jgi:hypothetical protein
LTFCVQTLDKCLALQKKCMSVVTHQKYRLGVIKKLIKDVEIGDNVTKEEMGEVADLNKDLLRRTSQLGQMQEVLPRQSGGILGNVDILDKNEKYQYKEQYEQFKLIVNLIGQFSQLVNRRPLRLFIQVEFWPPPTTF